MNYILSIHWLLIVALWYFVNGVLHDIFVLLNHKTGYDRELLRLLMDGHVLILSGAVLLVCYLMMLHNIAYGAWISIIIGAGMLVYCGMIFPFLKSMVTITLSIILIIVSVRAINV